MGLEKITYYREAQNMSIEELVKKSGVPIGTLSKISAGVTKNPRLETVRAIAAALGCTLNDLEDTGFACSPEERELITLYKASDDYGKETIRLIARRERDRANGQGSGGRLYAVARDKNGKPVNVTSDTEKAYDKIIERRPMEYNDGDE